MKTGYYFVISKLDPNYEQVMADCEAEHVKNCGPNHVLSIADLGNGEVLVKVKNGNSGWYSKKSWTALKTFNPDEDSLRVDYYNKEVINAN